MGDGQQSREGDGSRYVKADDASGNGKSPDRPVCAKPGSAFAVLVFVIVAIGRAGTGHFVLIAGGAAALTRLAGLLRALLAVLLIGLLAGLLLVLVGTML